MRPQTLRDLAERTALDGDWPFHLDEFLDEFYRRDGDRDAQGAMIAADPGLIGDARADAFIGGSGEHLALRWSLSVPNWIRAEQRYLSRAMYWPDEANLRRFLFAASPAAFRTRLIFTGPDPLQRARFPYRRGVRTMPFDATTIGPFPVPFDFPLRSELP